METSDDIINDHPSQRDGGILQDNFFITIFSSLAGKKDKLLSNFTLWHFDPVISISLKNTLPKRSVTLSLRTYQIERF